MNFIVINSSDKELFERLKSDSKIDFSRYDVRFIKYQDSFIIPESFLTEDKYREFRDFLDKNNCLDNLNIVNIEQEQLEEYWLSLEAQEL